MADAKGSKDQGSTPAAFADGRVSKAYPRVDSSVLSTGEVPRAPRVPVVAQVKVRYRSILDFHESQSLNISRTGMFLASDKPDPVGSIVEFEFALADGLSLLKGKGELQQPRPERGPLHSRFHFTRREYDINLGAE